MPIIFKNVGTFSQEGECDTTHGRFQWLRDGKWDAGWAVEPVADLLARMNLGGPYRNDQYQIVEAIKPELIIKSTCAGCGVFAGIDCQRTCEYIFGRADVTEALPIEFNADHQFSLSISVGTDGKNFGNKKPKSFTFNSVRCAELFLIEQGHCKRSGSSASGVIGNGERLLAFLGGVEVVKARKKRAPNKSYLAKMTSSPEIEVQPN